jgi:hypothetical protein
LKTNDLIDGDLEVRWFISDSLPTEIANWIENDSLFKNDIKVEERIDLYLIISNIESIGLKFREDKLEIKYRIKEHSLATHEYRIMGKAEIWTKWKWNFSIGKEKEVRQAFTEGNLKGQRVEVFKKRRQRKFEILTDSTFKQIPMNKRPSDGCLMELTELKVNDMQWWTIGIDYLTNSEYSVEMLEKAANYLFKDYPGPELRVENSYSYPGWLSKF